MVQAVVYLIEGPRSLSEAITDFNKADHSKKIFNNKSGMGSYLKSKIGRDFGVSALSKRNGFVVEEQIVNEKPNKFDIHIKLGKGAIGKHFNAVLIINKDIVEELYKPIYMIDCGDMCVEEDNWINITVPKSKLERAAYE